MDIPEAAKRGIRKFSAAAVKFAGGLQTKSDSNDTCITVMNDGKMRIDHDKLREVLIRPEIGDLPVAIISIAGSTRTGKSFLMNFIARYLINFQRSNSNWMAEDSGVYFRWKCGSKRTTTGIRILNDVFKIKRKDGREVAVLLMDSQGLFDKETPPDVNTTLLTLSTLMSSVLIFNTTRTVNTQDLDYLKTCVDFAMATAQVREPYFKLQGLVFLVRDALEEEYEEPAEEDGAERSDTHGDSEDYGFRQGEKYLVQEIINSEAGGEEQKAMRKRIKTSFKNVKCFMMPFPGENVMKRKFTGKNIELNDEFKKHVKIFVEEIAHPDKLPDEMAKAERSGRPAREILNMVAACDNIFAMKLYEAKNLMEANVKAHYASEYEEAIFQYDNMMKDYVEGSKLLERNALRDQHNYAKNQSLRRFKQARQLGDGTEAEFYVQHLDEKCEEHFDTTMETLQAKRNECGARIAMKTVVAVAEYEDQMRKKSGTGSVSKEMLQELHKKSIEQVIHKFEGRIDLDTFRNKTEAHFKELQKINEQRNKAEREIGEERRQQDLFALFVRLQDKVAKMWAEEIKFWIPDDELIAFAVEVRNKMTSEYFYGALLPHEDKYLEVLNAILRNQYEKAKEAAQSDQLSDSIDHPSLEEIKQQVVAVAQQLQAPADKKEYQLMVAEVVLAYAEELAQDLNNHYSIEDLDARNPNKIARFRQMYYDKCFPSIQRYFEDVECMLNNKCVEAKKRNAENWVNIKAGIEALVRTSVLEIERSLQEIMNDRYLEIEELRSHYDNLKEELAEKLPTKFLESFSKNFPQISDKFKEVIGRQLDESHDKTAEINEKNKGRRNVKTNNLKNSTSWLEKMWKAVKEWFADF